eukprot:750183-Hanusia_phi.AAC.2
MGSSSAMAETALSIVICRTLGHDVEFFFLFGKSGTSAHIINAHSSELCENYVSSRMGVLSILLRPSELVALIKLKRKISKWTKRASQQKKDADWLFCYDMLNKVSRSFAIVIQQLGDELRNAVCIFYLVLRGLDTIEDDMAIDKETKTKLLATFYQKLTDEKYCLSCEPSLILFIYLTSC